MLGSERIINVVFFCCILFLEDISSFCEATDTPILDLMVASMGAESFSSTYLRAGISGVILLLTSSSLKKSHRQINVITSRVAKRAKVMFSQACVTSTLGEGEGGGQHQRSQHLPLPPGPYHNTSLPPGPGHNTSLPPTRSQHPPPPRPGHNTSLPSRTRSQHLPSPLPRDQVTTPPSPQD